MNMRKIPKDYKPDASVLPKLLDADAEKKRVDSIEERKEEQKIEKEKAVRLSREMKLKISKGD